MNLKFKNYFNKTIKLIILLNKEILLVKKQNLNNSSNNELNNTSNNTFNNISNHKFNNINYFKYNKFIQYNKFKQYNKFNQYQKNNINIIENKILKILNIYSEYLYLINEILLYSKKFKTNENYYNKIIKYQIKEIDKNNKIITKKIFNRKKLDSKFLDNLNKMNNILLINKKNILILKNMIETYKNYKSMIDYEKFSRIKYNDLESGDIILTIKNKKLINKLLIRRLIYFITNSNIIHSTIFYKKKNEKYYFLDVNRDFSLINKTKFKFIIKKFSKNNIALILRSKKKLDKNKILKLIENSNGEIYCGRKVLTGLTYWILLKKIFFLHRMINPFKSKKVFCSENIVNIYEKLEIYLGDRNDNSTISPVDLLNSKELKIIGFIDY